MTKSCLFLLNRFWNLGFCDPTGTGLELFLEDLSRLNQLKDSPYQNDLEVKQLKL
ncbi:hypothetical protein [Galbibacter marinus]|uniref:hypothetical protein n=1 Tax=Galbibacter marinus TaxID=555500 RepID=UPI0003127352|nr:hypothetical protein [Galbibacter marinus]